MCGVPTRGWTAAAAPISQLLLRRDDTWTHFWADGWRGCVRAAGGNPKPMPKKPTFFVPVRTHPCPTPMPRMACGRLLTRILRAFLL